MTMEAVFVANGKEFRFDIPEFKNDQEKRQWWRFQELEVIRLVIPDWQLWQEYKND